MIQHAWYVNDGLVADLLGDSQQQVPVLRAIDLGIKAPRRDDSGACHHTQMQHVIRCFRPLRIPVWLEVG